MLISHNHIQLAQFREFVETIKQIASQATHLFLSPFLPTWCIDRLDRLVISITLLSVLLHDHCLFAIHDFSVMVVGGILRLLTSMMELDQLLSVSLIDQ